MSLVTHLVIVKVVGQASYEELMGGIRNDGRHDACRDDDKHPLKFRQHGVVTVAMPGLTWDVESRLL